MAPTAQRVATTTCAHCRKPLMPGDRVQTAFIVVRTGRNPETKELGAMLSGDFELVHISCLNPGLDGKVIVT